MTLDMRVTGAANLAVLAKQLKAVGDKDLQRELRAGLRRAVKPALADVAANARETLPSENGLAELVAATKFTISIRGGARNPGVRVKARSGTDVEAIDRGRLRHPVFGRRQAWVTQAVKPGWFTVPMDAAGPHIVTELNEVINRIASQLGL